jgi:hypothetical protein
MRTLIGRTVLCSALICALSFAATASAEAPEADWVELGAELHAAAGKMRGPLARPQDLANAGHGYGEALLAAYEKHIGEKLGDDALNEAIVKLKRDEKEPLAYERKVILLSGLSLAMTSLTQKGGDFHDNAKLSLMALLAAMENTSNKMPELMAEHFQLHTKPGQLSVKEADRLEEVKTKMAKIRKASISDAVFSTGALLGGTMPKAPQRTQPGLMKRLFGK